MKNSKKNILFITAFFIAILGIFSTSFFIREIILGIKSADELKREVGLSEVIDSSIENAEKDLTKTEESRKILSGLFADQETIQEKLDKIESDANLVRNSFEFVPVLNNDKLIFSGKSTGKFSEVTRQLQIIENSIYPIKISKVSLTKTSKSTNDSWVLFFEAKFLINEKHE